LPNELHIMYVELKAMKNPGVNDGIKMRIVKYFAV